MSGKPGCKSQKPTELAERYEAGYLDQLDGRVRVAKNLRERLGALVSDLGGLAALSYQERSLCRRVIHLERIIDKKELTLAHNGTIDEQSYYSALNALSGLFSKLGLKRRARKIASLEEYLKQQPEPGPACPEKPIPPPSTEV